MSINFELSSNSLRLAVACQFKINRHTHGSVKCMEYEVVISRPRGRPKRTWLEVVLRDCQVRGLSKDDAMVRGRWRKMIRMVVSGWVFLLVPAHPGRPGQRAVKRSCVCLSLY